MTVSVPSQDQESQRRRERLIRLTDASLRALSGQSDLHHRGPVLYDGSDPAPSPAMHLRIPAAVNFTSWRGYADSLSLRSWWTDQALHRAQRPEEPLAGALFDVFEQLRVESHVPASMPGMRRNIATRFDTWAQEFRSSDLADTTLGLMIFAVVLTARSRVQAVQVPEPLENLIEHTRFSMAEDIGAHCGRLRSLRHDQQTFAGIARGLAEMVADEVTDSMPATSQRSRSSRRGAMFSFLGWSESEDGQSADGAAGPHSITGGTAYRVFSTDRDRTVDVLSRCRPGQQRKLREQLNEELGRQRLNHREIARRIERRAATPVSGRWESGRDEGIVDRSRLAGLIASDSAVGIFQNEAAQLDIELSLTILLDCSGSMRRHQLFLAASMDCLARACASLEIPVEVLGFTTGSWNGGTVRRHWRRAGSVSGVGRVAEREHLVIKSFDADYRRRRNAFAALLKGDIYREGLDGEALDWACSRAVQREAERRVVVVISDGSPAESATAEANDDEYLSSHLRQVADRWRAAGTVEVAGLGLEMDMTPFYDRSELVEMGSEGGVAIVNGLLNMLIPPRR